MEYLLGVITNYTTRVYDNMVFLFLLGVFFPIIRNVLFNSFKFLGIFINNIAANSPDRRKSKKPYKYKPSTKRFSDGIISFEELEENNKVERSFRKFQYSNKRPVYHKKSYSKELYNYSEQFDNTLSFSFLLITLCFFNAIIYNFISKGSFFSLSILFSIIAIWHYNKE